MNSYITSGVKVSVETFYQQEYSNPMRSEYMFAYRITIENISANPIKLQSRHWLIFDSDGTYREIEGEGVVGMQPIIAAGEDYQYVSGCNLNSEIGRMHGSYLMENIRTKELFDVKIPVFEFYAPSKLN